MVVFFSEPEALKDTLFRLETDSCMWKEQVISILPIESKKVPFPWKM